MKKLIFALLMTLMCFGITGQTDERKIEVIPTISASGDFDSVVLNSELVIASKFHLSGKWNLYGQFGTMYNFYGNKIATERFSEWQLGFEPMVGIGTDRFRVSGFLNSLSIKAWDTKKMPFVEGGVRFSITPWKKLWLSIFSTWPISDPVFINSLEDIYFENNDGIFLVTSEQWSKQVRSYGADIDLGIGKKLILNLDGLAIDENNYQIGGGLQYRLFKNKPWIISGNVFYTNFKDNNYYYVQNIFPSMFENELQGYTFKLGVSNYGGLGEVNFSQLLGRIAQPMYFSPVKKEVKEKTIRITEAFKFEPCSWGGKCLIFEGSICITGGRPIYKIFVNWGDGVTESYTVKNMGPYAIKHEYLKEGEYKILISGMDALGKTHSYSGKFIADDCIPDVNPCEVVGMNFGADKTAITPGKTVNFNWDVYNADTVTFEGIEVAHKVSSYPVVFNTLGTFYRTLRAYSQGKLCKEQTVTITVTTCPTAEILSLSANPTEISKGGSSTISWVVKNWKTVTLKGENVTALTNSSGIGSKTYTGIINTTDYPLIVSNDCPSSANVSVRVTVKEELCTGTSITIGGKDTDTTRTVTLVNGGTITNSFTINAIGKQDSTTKATNSLTLSLPPKTTKIITVKYDKNITITFNGATSEFPAVPMCVYYLYITAQCNK